MRDIGQEETFKKTHLRLVFEGDGIPRSSEDVIVVEQEQSVIADDDSVFNASWDKRVRTYGRTR
jgi:hypothetical protein